MACKYLCKAHKCVGNFFKVLTKSLLKNNLYRGSIPKPVRLKKLALFLVSAFLLRAACSRLPVSEPVTGTLGVKRSTQRHAFHDFPTTSLRLAASRISVFPTEHVKMNVLK